MNELLHVLGLIFVAAIWLALIAGARALCREIEQHLSFARREVVAPPGFEGREGGGLGRSPTSREGCLREGRSGTAREAPSTLWERYDRRGSARLPETLP